MTRKLCPYVLGRNVISLACVFRSLFKGNLLERILFEISLSFLGCIAVFCQFLFQAKLARFGEIHQNVNDLVFRDKVEYKKKNSFLTLNWQSFLTVSNISTIPIPRWLLTVDFETAFFLFHSLAEGVLVFF